MSIGHCEVKGCRWPTMTGVICQNHWHHLTGTHDTPGLLARAVELADTLDLGPARGGEKVRRSTTVPMPVSVPVMDARAALSDALADAQRVICPGVPRLVIRDAVRLLWAHRARLRQSYVAPLLLEDLEVATRRAVQAVDTPRGRMSVPGRCRDCGPGMMHPVQGVLACDRCGVHHSVGEVRALM